MQRWGVEIEAVELKDLDIPEQMQRAIAREAEAIREKRARIIKAEGEMEAAAKLTEAAKLIGAHPAALEIRRLQTISEVGAEHNSTTVLTIPGGIPRRCLGVRASAIRCNISGVIAWVSGHEVAAKTLPLPLWERVGVRGSARTKLGSEPGTDPSPQPSPARGEGEGDHAPGSILPNGRPANRWTWKCGTSCPLSGPMLASRR